MCCGKWDALLPAVRDTVDEASVLQQSYFGELVTNLDKSLNGLRKEVDDMAHKRTLQDMGLLGKVVEMNTAILDMVKGQK